MYNYLKLGILSLVLTCATTPAALAEVSGVHQPDLGNGMYRNPVIDADYSDPDVVRVGNDYYMTASSFNNIPGLPILHSNDLVNWTIVGHAITAMPDYAQAGPDVQHGNAVWAPSIRYHDGEYYIYYGDPDLGIFMTKTRNPAGEWEPLVLVHPAKGIIDTCPLWDDDGRAYIAHGYAGSRAGVKSIIGMIEMTPDGKSTVGQDRIIYDGHIENETIEGAKIYKRDGWYYIFSPAGGVSTGWQEVLRSKNIWGPYEVMNVMDQGTTDINGPHQGAWVDTPDRGEDWFIHFQDKGPYGRVVHLQPMEWKENGWPVIGADPDGDGRGEPVATHRKPAVGATYPKANPQESDEFGGLELGKQWQWNGNPSALWYFCEASTGTLRLFSHHTPGAVSHYDEANMLLQKFPAENFTATAKVKFCPRVKNGKVQTGEKGGLMVMGYDYADVALESREDGIYIVEGENYNADKGAAEKEVQAVRLADPGQDVYLRVTVRRTGPEKPKAKADYKCEASFAYSLDGKKFETIGRPFSVREGHWIGAKAGLFCSRPWQSNDSGWLDVDWFRITK